MEAIRYGKNCFLVKITVEKCSRRRSISNNKRKRIKCIIFILITRVHFKITIKTITASMGVTDFTRVRFGEFIELEPTNV